MLREYFFRMIKYQNAWNRENWRLFSSRVSTSTLRGSTALLLFSHMNPKNSIFNVSHSLAASFIVHSFMVSWSSRSYRRTLKIYFYSLMVIFSFHLFSVSKSFRKKSSRFQLNERICARNIKVSYFPIFISIRFIQPDNQSLDVDTR